MIRAIYLKDEKGVTVKAQLCGFGAVFCACGRYLGQNLVVGQPGCQYCGNRIASIARAGHPRYEGTFNIDGSLG